MITFDVGGEKITSDEYMRRTGVTYFRAVHELNEIVNRGHPTMTFLQNQQNENTTPTKGELIEQRLDRVTAGAITISSAAGGISFTNMVEVMEFAKLMSLSREAVPVHLRNNPGMCLAVCIQASEWRMSPFAVANKSYVVNDRIAWESQLVHAVIEQRAPITGRIRHTFEGEGDARTCTVTAHVKGEVHPLSLTSPPIKQVRPEIFEKDGRKTCKGSPLWITKPDVQLYYNTVRDLARVYFPDVLMGVYSKDEMEEAPEMRARDVTGNGLHERLAAAAGQEGFKPGVVDVGLNGDADVKSAEPGGQAAGHPVDTPAAPVGSRKGRKKASQEPADEPVKEEATKEPPARETAPEAVEKPAEEAAKLQAQETVQPNQAGTPLPVRLQPVPKTSAEYLVYARAWLAWEDSADEIAARWSRERSLRNSIGMTSDERAPLEAEKKARLAALESGR